MSTITIGEQSSNRQKLTAEERARRNGRTGTVVWLTGLSGAGKSTIASELEYQLVTRGVQACLLDGDNVRHGLCKDLSFSEADRHENIRRIGEVARLLANTGLVCIVAVISPFRADRLAARQLMPPGQFFEIFISAPLAICEHRDAKGLYAKARQGKIAEFTGLTSPYENPDNPEMELHTNLLSVDECVQNILSLLKIRRGIVSDDSHAI